MIKVASYNMRKSIGTDRRRRPERTLQVLAEIDADVIALQECDRRFGERAAVITRHMLEEHTSWQAIPFGMRLNSMGWHGNAILVRKDAEILDCEEIHLPALEPRGAVRADVRMGRTVLRIVGMHLDLSGLWRRRQAHAILAHLHAESKRWPTVMMGDTNEWRAAGGCLQDFARDFDFAETGRSFHARRPVARLDRIMASRDLTITSAGSHDSAAARTASDHLPVWATVKPA